MMGDFFGKGPVGMLEMDMKTACNVTYNFDRLDIEQKYELTSLCRTINILYIQ